MLWVDPRSSSETPIPTEASSGWRSEGIDTLLFPALIEGRVYYPSNLLPPVSEDPTLPYDLRQCREAGGRTALVFQIFIHGGNPRDPAHLARLHPEWLSSTETGRSLKNSLQSEPPDLPFIDGFFLDPGIPRVREFMIALLTEALGELAPDWVVLDQVRYPFPEPSFEKVPSWRQPYGYHPVSRGAFRKRTGGPDPLLSIDQAGPASDSPDTDQEARNHLVEWDDFRRGCVDTFIEEVHELLLTQYPGTHLAVTGYPDPFFARRVLFQDWVKWLERGWVEKVFLPNHQSPLTDSIELSVLSPTIQEGIGLAGSLPKGVGIGEFLAGLTQRQLERGWIFFEWPPGGFRDETATEVSEPDVPDSALSFDDIPETDFVDEPPPSPPDRVVALGSPGESLPHPSANFSGDDEKESGSDKTIRKDYTSEVRALYGFDPTKPPFDGLSPEEVAAKVLDLGFNAVFGGGEREEIRVALREAGIRRFGEYPVFVGKSYWKKDPTSRPITSEGKPFQQQSWYAPLDPHQPWLREIKKKAILKAVREEELEGIWLDFIRFPLFWEEVPPKLIETSFSSAALTTFQETTGLIPEGNSTPEMAAWILENADEEWRRFRADTILSFVREVKEALEQEAPDVLLGAFVLPWDENDYGNAIYRIAGQDLKGFAGLVDILSPMVYAHQLGRPPEWIHERTRRLSEAFSIPVYPIVQCFDQPTPMLPEEVEESVRAGMYAPSSGVILFSQRHLESTNRWDRVRKVLHEEVPPTITGEALSTP